MFKQKFNDNCDHYPIVLIPENILTFFNKKISDNEILEYLKQEESIYSTQITTILHFGDKSKSIVGGKYLLNFYDLEYWKSNYPNFKKHTNNNGIVGYYYLYPINENDFFNDLENIGTFKIGSEKLPDKPKNYNLIYKQKNNNGLIVSFFVLLALIIILFYNEYYGFAIFLTLITAYSTFLSLIGGWEEFQKPKQVQIKELKPLEQFEEELHHYKNHINEIKLSVEKNNDIALLKNKQIAKENRVSVEQKLMLEEIKPLVQVKKLTENNNRGKTELFFLNELYATFGSQIKVDSVPNYGQNPFQPDYILVCNKTGVHIDIEIDEPYSATNGKPIHHDRSHDEDRNIFFLENIWGVIRFSEQQIVENTCECVELIKNVLLAINSKKQTFHHNVKPLKKWNYEEALLMSLNNFRNIYLPSTMKINAKNFSNNKSIDDQLKHINIQSENAQKSTQEIDQKILKKHIWSIEDTEGM